ncbi:hypothetical protein ACC720_38760, partial [Rhizobium ruizarguesonis]
ATTTYRDPDPFDEKLPPTNPIDDKLPTRDCLDLNLLIFVRPFPPITTRPSVTELSPSLQPDPSPTSSFQLPTSLSFSTAVT